MTHTPRGCDSRYSRRSSRNFVTRVLLRLASHRRIICRRVGNSVRIAYNYINIIPRHTILYFTHVIKIYYYIKRDMGARVSRYSDRDRVCGKKSLRSFNHKINRVILHYAGGRGAYRRARLIYRAHRSTSDYCSAREIYSETRNVASRVQRTGCIASMRVVSVRRATDDTQHAEIKCKLVFRATRLLILSNRGRRIAAGNA